MHALTRRWGWLAAVVAVAVLAPRLRADEAAPAARAMATLKADGITLSPDGGDMKFHVGKDVKDGEYLITVHVEYAGSGGPVKVDLPGVVVVGK